MSPRPLIVRAAVLATAALLPAAFLVETGSGQAAAGPPGRWTKVSTGTVHETVKPAVYRTGDGVLHVVYARPGAPGKTTYAHSAVTGTGQVKSRHVPIASWTNLSPPQLIRRPGGGMWLVFGAQRSTTTGDYYNDRVYAVRANSKGGDWTLEPKSFGSGYWAGFPAALTLASGTPMVAFSRAGGHSPIAYHLGMNDAPLSNQFSVPGYLHSFGLAQQGSKVYMSWSSWNDSPDGTFVKQILPTRGTAHEAPRSGHLDGPSAIVARRGGGIYLLYCTGKVFCDSLALWKMGTSKAYTVPQSAGARGPISISAAPGGRLWIAWTEGDAKVRAVRTGTNGLTFGAVRTIARGPWGSATPYEVAIEGSRGPADLIALANKAAWHQRILPGLTLRAQPRRWPARTRKTVTFTVLDAGMRVRNARVSALSRSCTTNARGRCTITFPAMTARRFGAVARKAGYAAATVRLRIG